MLKHILIHRILRSVFFVIAALFIVLHCNASSDVHADSANLTISSSTVLELVVPSSVSLDLDPSITNDHIAFNTTSLSIGVGTNNPYGYTLSMTTSSANLTRTSSITDGNNNTTAPIISPLSTTGSSTGYSLSDYEGNTYNTYTLNTWGYKLSSATNFMPMTTSTIELASTNAAANTNTTTLNFAAKVDTTKPAGTYNTTINFTVVTNVPPTVIYDEIVNQWVAGGSRVQTNGTNTTTGIQTAISTTNSGVYEYDESIFGAASDASSDYPIYYYRGILDSNLDGTTSTYGSNGDGVTWPNYVRLGTGSTATCWRIVRTTGSGGVKMIYNGVYGDTAANSCANATTAAQIRSTAAITAGNTATFTSAFAGTAAAQYRSIVGIGYTRNNTYASTSATTDTAWGTLVGTNSSYSGNSTDSTIKGNIETWYNNNLSAYTSILEPSAGYCNDRSLYASGSYAAANVLPESTLVKPYGASGMTQYYFGAYTRNMNNAQKPTLGCPRNVVDLYTTNSASGGNKQLGKPIALLTADEASFAGSGSSTASQGSSYHANSFLRSGSDFWLLSSYDRYYAYGYAGGFILNSGGRLSGGNVNNANGARPVISLNPGTTAVSGAGTATDPWVVNAP